MSDYEDMSDCGVEYSDAPVSSPITVLPQQHSNENLLKLDTHDKYLTANAMKKYIANKCPPTLTGNVAAGEPLFQGLLRVGKNPSSPILFFSFETEERRDYARDVLLKHMTYRDRPWVELPVTDRDLMVTHRGAGKIPTALEKDAKRSKSSRQNQEFSQIAAWATTPYAQQVQKKMSHCRSIMKRIASNITQKTFGNYTAETLAETICMVKGPVLSGYRNNVNFSCGYDAQRRPAIGFMAGSVADGRVHIEDVVRDNGRDNIVLPTTNPISILYARAVMQVYRIVHSKYLASNNVLLGMFDKAQIGGATAANLKTLPFWRRVHVRHNVRGDVMVDLEVDPEGLASEQQDEIRQIIIDNIQCAEKDYTPIPVVTDTDYTSEQFAIPTCRLVSLQWHFWTGNSTTPQDVPRVSLFGATSLNETLSGHRFYLSPGAFFQVNTLATEKMLEKVAEVAQLKPTTTLLDICCGTGTIGICLARHVKRVIGIEMISSAIEDAKVNAALNNVKNAIYYAGKVEDVISSVLARLTPEERGDIVAIFDPPRAGLHSSVLRAARATPSLRRIVYISCDQNALLRDCPMLTKEPTNQYRGMPFVFEAAFGVDLFPHTPHVEMVVVMQRVEINK